MGLCPPSRSHSTKSLSSLSNRFTVSSETVLAWSSSSLQGQQTVLRGFERIAITTYCTMTLESQSAGILPVSNHGKNNVQLLKMRYAEIFRMRKLRGQELERPLLTAPAHAELSQKDRRILLRQRGRQLMPLTMLKTALVSPRLMWSACCHLPIMNGFHLSRRNIESGNLERGFVGTRAFPGLRQPDRSPLTLEIVRAGCSPTRKMRSSSCSVMSLTAPQTPQHPHLKHPWHQ
jgi:hypothetical protein